MRAIQLVRSRDETIVNVTTNIRQYYTTDPQTDGILVLVQDEGDTLLVRSRDKQMRKYQRLQVLQDEGDTTREI